MTWQTYVRCTACSGRAQPGTQALLSYLLQRFPYTRSLGIYSCRTVAGQTTLSQHACGRALDLGIPTNSDGSPRRDLGDPVTIFLYDNSTFLGLTEDIYARVRYDAGAPRGRYYGGVHPHNDHHHMSQTPTRAASLTYAGIVAELGSPRGDGMLLKRGDTGHAVAEWQKGMAQFWNQNNGIWPPFKIPGTTTVAKSVFDGDAFTAGQDGDFGGTAETNTKNVQGVLGLPKTGIVDDLLWGAMLAKYATPPSGDFASKTDLANHAKAKPSAQVHPHGHDEGQTGPPI